MAIRVKYLGNGKIMYYDASIYDPPAVELGKFGRMRYDYLKAYQYEKFTEMQKKLKLKKHLYEIDEIANKRFEECVEEYLTVNRTEDLSPNIDWKKWRMFVCEAKIDAHKRVVREIIMAEM